MSSGAPPEAPAPHGPGRAFSPWHGGPPEAAQEREEALGSAQAQDGVGSPDPGWVGAPATAVPAQGPVTGPSSLPARGPSQPAHADAATLDGDSDFDMDLDFDFASASGVEKLAASIRSALVPLAAGDGAASTPAAAGEGRACHQQLQLGRHPLQQQPGSNGQALEQPQQQQQQQQQPLPRWEPETGLRPLLPGQLAAGEPAKGQSTGDHPAPPLGASRALTRVAGKEPGLAKRLLAPPRDEVRDARAARKAAPETAGERERVAPHGGFAWVLLQHGHVAVHCAAALVDGGAGAAGAAVGQMWNSRVGALSWHP